MPLTADLGSGKHLVVETAPTGPGWLVPADHLRHRVIVQEFDQLARRDDDGRAAVMRYLFGSAAYFAIACFFGQRV